MTRNLPAANKCSQIAYFIWPIARCFLLSANFGGRNVLRPTQSSHRCLRTIDTRLTRPLRPLGELLRTLTQLYRLKSSFDKRILEGPSTINLAHHIRPIRPWLRYVRSEYVHMDISSSGRPVGSVWASLNVLSLQGEFWLIASHFQESRSLFLDISKEIDNLATRNLSRRRQIDLDALGQSANLFASPEDYNAFPADDQASISASIAKCVVQDPLSQSLKVLRSSPAAERRISEIEASLRIPRNWR